MKITLKNVMHNSRLSEETPCFSAAVCLDGIAVLHASNRGHGGATDFGPLKSTPESRKLFETGMQQLTAHAALLPKRTAYGHAYQPDVEAVIMDALTKHLEAKRFKRLLAKKILVVRDARVYGLGIREGRTIAGAAQEYQVKNPGVRVLNTLPFDTAFEEFYTLCTRESESSHA